MTPYHPAFVHLPIALLTFSFLTELLGRITGKDSLRASAWYSLIGAVIGTALSVVFGLWDMNRYHETMSRETDEFVHWHMRVGYALLAAVVALTLWRWFSYSRVGKSPGWGYLIASLLVMGLTYYQGWLGGEVVFSHGVGVAPAESASGGGHSHDGAEGSEAKPHRHEEATPAPARQEPAKSQGHAHDEGDHSH